MNTTPQKEERTDINVFTGVSNLILEALEVMDESSPIPSGIGPYGTIMKLGLEVSGGLASQGSDGELTRRDLAEAFGEIALGAAAGAAGAWGYVKIAAAGAASGAARGFLGGPKGALGGAIAGTVSSLLTSPIGGTIMGAIYDQAMKKAPTPSSTDQLRKYIDKMVDPNFQWFRDDLKNNPSIPVPPEYKNPLAPTYGPVTPGGPPTTVQTPSGPQVVNPGSTYVPPGSPPPPAPKPAIPPTVTWGPMASPGVPGGSGPVAKDKGNLKPTTGGSGGGGGGGGSGSGSGSGGGGYVNNGNNPGNNNAPGYNGSSGNKNNGGYVNNGNNPGNNNAPGYNSPGGNNNNNKNQNKGTNKNAKPMILDLGGDGFDVSFTGTARFDMDGDGFRERVGWADAQDALLVLDLNADG
ncbi:MAG: hypothetical protein IM635_09555, partial [Phenylobacterium sp.]|nr:hypothetical protein [Phenylobacterium sp.]